MSKKSNMSKAMVEYLNKLLAMEADTITALMEIRVPCGSDFINHPTVQVIYDGDGNSLVGLLGILNGFVGKNADDNGTIIAHFDYFGKITKFSSNCDESTDI